jgi:glyoxylase-like metal-dependent hydrolase (beta-lactamase superfamily II)
LPVREGKDCCIQLSPHLLVYQGPVNVGILRSDDGRALLLECGAGPLPEILPSLGIRLVETILVSHHHRDQVCGAELFLRQGSKLLVPAEERTYFEKPEEFWGDPRNRWHQYNFRPHRWMLPEGLPVADVCADGQRLRWGPAEICTLATPGHTDGSVSFLVQVDGRKVLFCGDLLAGPGRVWNLYSLQKGFARGKRRIGGYHGYMGAQWELKESLRKIRQEGAELLVPAHGHLVEEPAAAIDLLLERLEACYREYVAISALRHYFPELFEEYQDLPGQLNPVPQLPVPDGLLHVGTTWIVLSRENKAAFVMDCGNPGVVDWIRQRQQAGEIGPVEALWITHYHDDHVHGIPEFRQVFDAPVITEEHVATVVSQPEAWRLPCLSPKGIPVDQPLPHRHRWQWHEYTMTAFHFPGQTLYHAGLLVERGQLRMFFAGDSFTPAGIDDYCMQNRNFLAPGLGFDFCLQLFEEVQPTHIFNCHVDRPFRFSREEIALMRANLVRRRQLLAQLLPWDDPNYGMDEWWVRCFPYEQKVHPGDELSLAVQVTNHSPRTQATAARVNLPRAWGGGQSTWQEVSIAGSQDGEVRFCCAVPEKVAPGRYVLVVDLRHGPWELPQFTEAIVEVSV